jgi:hypothetical protein
VSADWFVLALRTITQLFAIVKRAARAAKQDSPNDFQNHSLPRCRDPDFPLRTHDLFRRTTRINEGLSEFKKQANLAVSIFLFLIVCVVVFAAGKLAWTWWSSL